VSLRGFVRAAGTCARGVAGPAVAGSDAIVVPVITVVLREACSENEKLEILLFRNYPKLSINKNKIFAIPFLIF